MRHDTEVCYGSLIHLCEGTDFLLFLAAVDRGLVYFDPGIKMEQASSGRPVTKRRSQFWVKHKEIGALYRRDENVGVGMD